MSLVVIGNFDGVHRGHQTVLAAAASDARRLGITPRLLTFDPHPAKALGRPTPPVLTALPRKLELIRRVDPAIEPSVLRFDATFAAQSPDEFAERVLVGLLGAKVVLVGHNFRFGQGRAGDLDTLARIGERLGFETRSHPLAGDEVGAWSSTRIREAIAAGDLAGAEIMLGRPHMLSGVVARGDQRGRTIGFPTCNLADVPEALPPFGVYAVLVDRVAGGRPEALARGVANIGVRPTVAAGDARPSVEAHLLDVDRDLYGAELRAHLVSRLRPERKFTGLDALKAQIADDAAAARAALAPLTPDPSAAGGWR